MPLSEFMAFDPFLVTAAILAVGVTCIFVFYSEWSSGALVTLGNYYVARYLLVPVVVLGWVAVSKSQNLPYRHMYVIQDNIGRAAVLTIAFLVPFIVGYLRGSRVDKSINLTERIHALGYGLCRSDFLLLVAALGTLMLLAALSTGASFGDFRGHGLRNRSLLPLFIFFTSLVSFGLLAAAIRAMTEVSHMNRLAFGLLALYLAFLSVGAGTRTALLDPLIVVAAAYFQGRRRSGIVTMVLLLPVMIVFAVVIADFRDGREAGLSLQRVSEALMYGPNFPDFRNLSWILGYYPEFPDNGLWGRTILSSIISFIPNSIASWRYGWGDLIPEVLRMDTELHPGVRALPFTEWYFNFGYVGLFVSGFMYGQILRICSYSKLTIGADRMFFVLGGYFIYTGLGRLFSTTPGLVNFYPVLILYVCLAILRRASPGGRLMYRPRPVV